MQVKFLDLSLPTGQIKADYLACVEKLLNKANFILTEEVSNFERAWADIIGTKYSIGTSSGADALYLALVALGIGPGDEVIIQGNAYNASVTAILRAGAAPKFVDIDALTLTLDINLLERAITGHTKAILPVHLFGQMNDMKAISEIALRHNLFVVEDCAQAHLAEFGGEKAGAWGHISAFSFYPTKNLGAFGDAGAVVTKNEEWYKKIIALRNLGQTKKNQHIYLGFNMRLDPIQAVALSLKLPFLRENTIFRQQEGDYYDLLIKNSNIPVVPVKRLPGGNHVYHLYIVQLQKNNRSEVQAKLLNSGVETAVHYPLPVYRQPFYRGPAADCPVTDAVADRILSLPLHLSLTKSEQEYVINSLKEAIS